MAILGCPRTIVLSTVLVCLTFRFPLPLEYSWESVRSHRYPTRRHSVLSERAAAPVAVVEGCMRRFWTKKRV